MIGIFCLTGYGFSVKKMLKFFCYYAGGYTGNHIKEHIYG